MHLLALCSCILKFLVMLIETIHIKLEEQFCLIALLGGSFVESEHEHGECNFNEGLSLRWLFILIIVLGHNIAKVKWQVGITHVITIHEQVSLVVVYKGLLEELSSEQFFLIRVDQAGVNCNFVHLVPLSVVVGLDEFGGFYLLAALATLKVVIMLVLHMQVECRITEVLLRTEAFVPGQVLVELGLRPPSLFIVLLLLARWITPLH